MANYDENEEWDRQQWQREESERKWEEESLERQRAERVEAGISYDGGGDNGGGGNPGKVVVRPDYSGGSTPTYSWNGWRSVQGGGNPAGTVPYTGGNVSFDFYNGLSFDGGDQGGGGGDSGGGDSGGGGDTGGGSEPEGPGESGGTDAGGSPVPVSTPETSGAEADVNKPGEKGTASKEEEPVVFTGGSSTGVNTGGKGSGAAGTKDALMENGMPEGYMDWTAAQWAEWQKNPENREAAVRAANAPLAAARGERTLQDREHILGAGPNEPGAPVWPVANPQGQLHYLGAGPSEPGEPSITVAPRNYMSDYQPNPALNELLNPPVGSPQYLSDNGLSWAGGGQPAGGGAVVNTTSVTDDYPGGAQAMLEDGIRIRMGQGMSYAQARQETQADIARQNLSSAAAGKGISYQPYQPVSQGAAVRDQSRNGEPGNQRYDARTGKGSNTFREINEGMGNAEIYSIVYNNALLSGMSPESAAVAAAEGVNHWRDYNPRDIAAKIGATIENADVYEDWLRDNTDLGSRSFASEEERVRYEQGLGNAFEKAAAAGEIEGLTSSAEIRERLDRMRDQEQARIDRLKELAEQHSESIGYEGAAQKAEAEGYLPGTKEYDQAVYQNMQEQQAAARGQTAEGNYRTGEPGNQRYVYRPEASGTGQQGTDSGQQGAGNGRPGVDAEIMSWGGEPAAANYRTGEPGGQRYDVRLGLQGAGAGNGTGAGAGTGSGAGAGTESGLKGGVPAAGNGKDSGKGTDIPKGSKIYEPTYGQGGQVVKAPYTKDGYSEDALIKMGNRSYGTRYGKETYEGYYLAPNGKYYPVDQVKANYYRQNGNSYKGWEEGMRDYWNNFGTFYGYRSDWRKAGRAVPNYSGGRGGYGGSGGRGYSYGGGSSYGNGSTANNGLYWNPNTSWSI